MAGTARSVSNEPYLAYRFHVEDTNGYFSGGFSSATLPEHNITAIEYSEGNATYSKIYPARSTFTTVTLVRGVFLGSSEFAKWVRNCAEGRNYRTNLRIKVFHRSEVAGLDNYAEASPRRIIDCYNCIPIRFKPGSDGDAMTSDVSVEEIEIQPERFYVRLNGQEIK